MCDVGGGGGGGGFGGGFGGGGGGFDLGALDFGGGTSGATGLDLPNPITIPSIDFSGVITNYADRKAQEFDDAYTAARTQDALTKSYFANARRAGVAEDVSDSLANIFQRDSERKNQHKENYKNQILNKYPNNTSILAPDFNAQLPGSVDPSVDPIDQSVINEGLFSAVDDGTRLAEVGGARRFVGRQAPKLFGGEGADPLSKFKTSRRFNRDNTGAGFGGFSTDKQRAS